MTSLADPATCTPISATAQPVSPRASALTTSAEKAEKVVRPPRNPVMTNSRTSCGQSVRADNSATATPTR
jgi:hypothetical protein